MRIRKTFILRLLIDSESPDQLKGDLAQVGEHPQFFHSDTELVFLLKNMAAGVLGWDRDLRQISNTRLPDQSNISGSKIP